MPFVVQHGVDRYAKNPPRKRVGEPTDPADHILATHTLVFFSAILDKPQATSLIVRAMSVSKAWRRLISSEPLLFSKISIVQSYVHHSRPWWAISGRRDLDSSALKRLLLLAAGKLTSLQLRNCRTLELFGSHDTSAAHGFGGLLAEQPRLRELKLLNCPMISGSIVEQLPPQPLRLTLSGCTIAPLHIMILEARGVADKVDVAVCLNCTQATEKRGQFKCGGCGEDRCSAPMSGMPNGRPLPCDDTTRCGACELVLCRACDDRKHKCGCCDDVFCDGCVGKSAAAQSQLCAFCEEEAYGECVSFTCSECDVRGCEGCRDDYTDACATCCKQICRECREEQDDEPGQWWTTCVVCEALQCPACHADWDCEDCGKSTCSAPSGAKVAEARCLRGRSPRDGEAMPQPRPARAAGLPGAPEGLVAIITAARLLRHQPIASRSSAAACATSTATRLTARAAATSAARATADTPALCAPHRCAPRAPSRA